MTRADIVQNQIKTATPLEMAKTLNELELYDKKEAQEIIDEVYRKFDSGEHLTDNLLKPVVISVADGVLELKMFSPMRKKGLTASRIYEECANFTYDSNVSISEIDGYTEYKSMRDEIGYDADYTTSHNRESSFQMGETAEKILGKKVVDELNDADYSEMYRGKDEYRNKDMAFKYKGNRKKFEDQNKMDKYKDDVYGDKDVIKDEYFPNRDLPKDKAQTDHIIPEKVVYEQVRGNIALNNADVKEIANQKGNYAVTDGSFNQSKQDTLNEHKKTYKKGVPLTKDEYDSAAHASVEAQKVVNAKINESVFKTLTGKGNVSVESTRSFSNRIQKREVDKFKRRNGREPNAWELEQIKNRVKQKTKKRNEQMEKIVAKKQFDKAKNTYRNIGKAAVNQSKDFAIGNLLLCLLKPVVYEFRDIFRKGLKAKDLHAGSNIEAIKLRFKRVKDYIFSHLKEIVQGNLTDFIKSLVSSFIEGIIDCFVGMVKKAIKIVKEGIKIFVKAYKILWGKDGEGLTDRQKWDAVIKMIGASIGILAGIGIEAVLQSFAIPKFLLVPISTFLGGVITAVFMYVLDKADLFSTKSEQRRNAIVKIFDARITEIKGATEAMNTSAIEVLNEQRKCYDNISVAMKNAINTKNYVELNNQLFVMAKFFSIELPYSNSDEFVKHYDSVRELVLN